MEESYLLGEAELVVDTGKYVVKVIGDYFSVNDDGHLCVYKKGEDDLLVGVFNHWESAYIKREENGNEGSI